MTELFRLKITSKRDVILPARMISRLRLVKGDELQIQVNDDDSLVIQKVDGESLPALPDASTLMELNRRSGLAGSPDLAKKFLDGVRAKRRKAAVTERAAGAGA